MVGRDPERARAFAARMTRELRLPVEAHARPARGGGGCRHRDVRDHRDHARLRRAATYGPAPTWTRSARSGRTPARWIPPSCGGPTWSWTPTRAPGRRRATSSSPSRRAPSRAVMSGPSWLSWSPAGSRGARRRDEITFFKSVGFALEDTATARLAYDRAVEAQCRHRGRALSGSGRIVQISVSPGGVPKRPVEPADVTAAGLAGDAQRDLEHHGGPDRALCLFSMELIRALQAEGHPIAPGHIGENLTVEGLDWERGHAGRPAAPRARTSSSRSPATRAPAAISAPRSRAGTTRASPRSDIPAPAASTRGCSARGRSGAAIPCASSRDPSRRRRRHHRRRHHRRLHRLPARRARADAACSCSRRSSSGAGGTGRSVGIIRQLYPTRETSEMVLRSPRRLRALRRGGGGRVGLRPLRRPHRRLPRHAADAREDARRCSAPWAFAPRSSSRPTSRASSPASTPPDSAPSSGSRARATAIRRR